MKKTPVQRHAASRVGLEYQGSLVYRFVNREFVRIKNSLVFFAVSRWNQFEGY